jgi:endonuclease YncB( thermonuclease family)
VPSGCRDTVGWTIRLTSLIVAIALTPAARGFGQTADASATVNPWATGGVPGVAKPGEGGKPLPYWQAPALPQAVIAGGTIPVGWTPQAVPYTGIGPDGRPMTAYYAPTYTFTYQAGPPMLAHAVPGTAPMPSNQVNRPQAWGYQPAPVTYAVPPATVARYQPAPYQFPAGSPQLAGTPIAPPPGPIPPAVVPLAAAPPMIAQQPLPPPPTQWGPAPQQMPPQLVPQPMAQPLPQQAVPQQAVPQQAVPQQAPPQWGPSAEPAPGLVPQQPAAPPAAAAFGAAPAAAAGAAFASANQQNQIPPIGSPAAAAAPVAPPPRGGTRLWRVVGVNDGDTITCLDESNQQQKVRLASIDAPEIGQEYGKTARENLAALVFGKTVEVIDEGKDRYGRTVGQVTCNGMDVNRQMIASGNAWHFAEYSNDASLAALQSQAQAQRLGLWATPNPTPPWDYRDTLKRPST